MEPLYKTNTKYTFEEYKKFNYAITTIINKMHVKTVIVVLLFVLLACMYMQRSMYATSIMLLCAFIFPFLFYFTINGNIKKTYNSNKSMKDLDVEFEFYKEYCLYKCKLGETKLEYKDLYKVIETKTNFYLMIAKNQGIILKKENCDEELQKFIKELSN